MCGGVGRSSHFIVLIFCEPFFYTEKEVWETYIEKFWHWHISVHF